MTLTQNPLREKHLNPELLKQIKTAIQTPEFTDHMLQRKRVFHAPDKEFGFLYRRALGFIADELKPVTIDPTSPNHAAANLIVVGLEVLVNTAEILQDSGFYRHQSAFGVKVLEAKGRELLREALQQTNQRFEDALRFTETRGQLLELEMVTEALQVEQQQVKLLKAEQEKQIKRLQDRHEQERLALQQEIVSLQEQVQSARTGQRIQRDRDAREMRELREENRQLREENKRLDLKMHTFTTTTRTAAWSLCLHAKLTLPQAVNGVFEITVPEQVFLDWQRTITDHERHIKNTLKNSLKKGQK